MRSSDTAAGAQDLEQVPGLSAAAIRMLENGETVFTRDSAQGLIKACTAAQIAVIGVEMFPGLNVSTYDQLLRSKVKEASWPQYARINKILAEEFLRNNRAPTGAECVLTTASWREFCQIQQFRLKS